MAHEHGNLERLTEKIIGCAIEVHRTLGPGLLESLYQECLVIELAEQQLSFEADRCVNLEYKGRRIRHTLRLDLLVEGVVVVELKSVERLHPVHSARSSRT